MEYFRRFFNARIKKVMVVEIKVNIPDEMVANFTPGAIKGLTKQVEEYTLEVVQETERIDARSKEDGAISEIIDTHIIQAAKAYRAPQRKNKKAKVCQIIASILGYIAGIMFVPEWFKVVGENGNESLNMVYLCLFLVVSFVALATTIISHFIGDD